MEWTLTSQEDTQTGRRVVFLGTGVGADFLENKIWWSNFSSQSPGDIEIKKFVTFVVYGCDVLVYKRPRNAKRDRVLYLDGTIRPKHSKNSQGWQKGEARYNHVLLSVMGNSCQNCYLPRTWVDIRTRYEKSETKHVFHRRKQKGGKRGLSLFFHMLPAYVHRTHTQYYCRGIHPWMPTWFVRTNRCSIRKK